MTIYAERPTSMYGRGARVGGWVRTVICDTYNSAERGCQLQCSGPTRLPRPWHVAGAFQRQRNSALAGSAAHIVLRRCGRAGRDAGEAQGGGGGALPLEHQEAPLISGRAPAGNTADEKDECPITGRPLQDEK